MPYQSIFNSSPDFSQDFKPGQSAKVNANIAKKNNPQDSLLNSPAPAGNSLLSKIKKVAIDVGSSAISGENTVAKGIARELPGGTNDLTASVQQGNQATKNIQQIKQQEAAGKLSKPIASKLINEQAASADNAQKQVTQTQKTLPSKGQLAAGFGSTAADILTGGEYKGLKVGGEAAIKGAEVADGAEKALSTAEKVKKVAPALAVRAGGNATAGALNAASSGGTKKQVAENAAAGAVLPEALGLAGRAFSKGASDTLSKLKAPAEEADNIRPRGVPGEPQGNLPKQGMNDVMTNEQADKAAAAAYTKITPKDESSGAEQVGVRTPTHAGIKQQSETYKIGVRTPTHAGIKEQSSTYNIGVSTKQTMADEQYTKEFNSLSNAYDKEMKSVEGKPDVIQEALAGHIDNKYQVLIGDLNDRYKNGYMSEAAPAKKVASETSSTKKVVSKVPAPKRIASETSKAEKPTGGAPKSGVNVRSDNYRIGERSRVTPEEANAKLQSAGYSPDETKTILQDALPEKGLSMPGSPKKIGLNDASVQKSASNFDSSQAPKEAPATEGSATHVGQPNEAKSIPVTETPAEPPASTGSSNLRPLQATETSEQGVSKLGASVQEKALQDKIISKTEQETEGLPTYNKANLKEQAQFATELVKNDPEKAINIALGKETAPAHILTQMVYNAVEEYAKGIGGEDGAKLLLDLSKSKQSTNLTKMGQEIRAAGERDPHSPTNLINQVAVARASKVKGGAKAVTAAIKADAKAIAKATTPIKKDDWQSFVEGLRC